MLGQLVDLNTHEERKAVEDVEHLFRGHPIVQIKVIQDLLELGFRTLLNQLRNLNNLLIDFLLNVRGLTCV